MTTWHQQKAMARDGVRLYHHELWTVVTGGNGVTAVIRFHLPEDAQRHADKTGGYVLPPHRG